jgi:hypothetical protein
VSKSEDSGRLKKLEQVPRRQSRGRTGKREQTRVSPKEQTSRDFLTAAQKIKATIKVEIC